MRVCVWWGVKYPKNDRKERDFEKSLMRTALPIKMDSNSLNKNTPPIFYINEKTRTVPHVKSLLQAKCETWYFTWIASFNTLLYSLLF